MCTTLVPSTRWHQWSIQLIKKLFWVLVNTQKSNAFRIVRIAGLCLLHVLCWQTQKKKKGYCNYVCFFIQSAIHVKVQDDKSSLLLVVSSIFIIIVVCGLWCVNRRFLSRHLWSIQMKMKLFQWQRLFFFKINDNFVNKMFAACYFPALVSVGRVPI